MRQSENLRLRLRYGPEYNETSPNHKDLTRTVEETKEARRQADIVLVFVHAHEMKGADSKVAAQFVETFARVCIDAGASAVIGHGPHELRGIEVYNGGLIFYSLGNFFSNRNGRHATVRRVRRQKFADRHHDWYLYGSP